MVRAAYHSVLAPSLDQGLLNFFDVFTTSGHIPSTPSSCLILTRTVSHPILLKLTQRRTKECLWLADYEACLLLQFCAPLWKTKPKGSRMRDMNWEKCTQIWPHWVTFPEHTSGDNSGHIIFYSCRKKSTLEWTGTWILLENSIFLLRPLCSACLLRSLLGK